MIKQKDIYVITFIFLLCTSCNKKYESLEEQVINDALNAFLLKYQIDFTNVPPPESINVLKSKVAKDTANLGVYVSDALLPIAQFKEDNKWMFSEELSNNPKFKEIVNSRKFEELSYREFNKERLNIIDPYVQLPESNNRIRSDKQYSIFSFSRVCFDEGMENAVLVIHYERGFETGSMSGYYGALLIEKRGENWEIVER
ncbi:hypothetical protein PZB74_20560 [Porifericola rhodea]|uniref:hypothetical protein n=1 Tax=Porifericola rhodea TaxID=930972 RepID=UPI0026655187|nr:hypothetical protein [Porifericola rhodea]WKN31346.1 hypothetical protein PZB74_20560 [Porifericola rhodea]